MKKSIILLSFAIAIASIIGCSKDGATGPAGATGPQGPTGPAIVAATDSFYVASGSWVSAGANEYTYTYSNANITSAIVVNGTIQVEDWYTGQPGWFSWPDVVAGGGGYRFSYTVGSVTLYADNFSSGPPSYGMAIKATLIP